MFVNRLGAPVPDGGELSDRGAAEYAANVGVNVARVLLDAAAGDESLSLPASFGESYVAMAGAEETGDV